MRSREPIALLVIGAALLVARVHDRQIAKTATLSRGVLESDS